MDALAFLALNWRVLLLGGVGAALMWLFTFWLWLPLVHDPAVAREARRHYVAIAEMERAVAAAETAQRLLEASRKKAEELEAEKASYAAALAAAMEQIEAADDANATLQEEIDALQAKRPSGVPTVGDLGVRLRN